MVRLSGGAIQENDLKGVWLGPEDLKNGEHYGLMIVLTVGKRLAQRASSVGNRLHSFGTGKWGLPWYHKRL
jgi:hypothetical protein